uniref:SUEL-type lectin domain-containing protein n=1 Tax=Myripristis murdjan TaxID=586833 RepID=A0A667ZDN2_9TELE
MCCFHVYLGIFINSTCAVISTLHLPFSSSKLSAVLCVTASAVISVESTLYGRSDSETCSTGRPAEQLSNTECSLQGTLEILKSRCNGKRVCELNANVFQSSDPCPGTHKYLETTVMSNLILDTLTVHIIAFFPVSLSDPGQIIVVHSADYGRHDRTTCSYKRPASQLQNVYCSRPTKKVAESCNGRNSCTIYASNSVFGDPCHGTYKYLELIYTCQCKCLKRGCFTFILLRLTVGFHHMCKKKTPGAGK